MSRSIPYRPEIDGLRTVAIIPVILFHLGFDWIKGGYLGVDVFFVISGYLITSIILKEQAAGSFRFTNFWMRRVRRIFPVLTVMVLFTLLAASLISFKPALADYGKMGGAAILSIANLAILKMGGSYWSAAAEESPFLHTWSLSVEEQFYLVYPVVLIALITWIPRWSVKILIVSCGLGFCLFLWVGSRFEAYAFYLLPTRAWELGVGCLAGLLHFQGRMNLRSTTASLCSILGIGLICISYLGMLGSGEMNILQALPILGAFLVISNRSQSSPINIILSRTPMVFIGKISYSLYVWHWPVIVLGKPWFYFHFGEIPIFLTLILISLISLLSYFLIEKKTRKMTHVVPFVGVTMVLSGFFAMYLGFSNYSIT